MIDNENNKPTNPTGPKKRPTPHELVEQAKLTINLANRISLNRVEVAAVMGLRNPISVDRLVKRGLLKPSRATRRPVFLVEEVLRLLRETQ